MTPFPEEQLDSPAGYLPGYPGMTLQLGKWTIIRKLGWGERSSVWLVYNTSQPLEFRAIKVLTVAESNGATGMNELRVLRMDGIKNVDIPQLLDSFQEGDHLCLVFNPHGITVENMRKSNMDGGYVAAHLGKQIASWTLTALLSLEDLNLVHGAIAADHIVIGELDQGDVKTADPVATVDYLTSNGVLYPLVKSQPIDPKGWDSTWNEVATDFAGKTLFLLNMGHGKPQSSDALKAITSSKSVPLAPEVLRGQSLGSSSDVWQLGWMIFLLLSGMPLLDQGSYINSPVESLTQSLEAPGLENRLSRNTTIAKEDLESAASLLRSLLAADPLLRPSLEDLLDNRWIQEGDLCSCGWCQADRVKN
ncbi:hypothetical protein GALMADRAFT_78567 [Galerina marginata CBS 339.88]|uniref:non-specific serine/threonine protein kinase n=1 Tax=Galerina marginata (strain CBS 339.88) TaxID=685588 RepID=A0A067SNJ7_GALM3|nr:hypothetical protein GALMADRAFT_78567 [Galerina marginata CBS 339.88]